MLATHNSLTYAKGKTLLGKLLTPTWRCQDITIVQQYDMGVRMFDIRVAFNNGAKVYHGFTELKIDINAVLLYLDTKGDCYVRIVLERVINNTDYILFARFCSDISDKYKNIKFFGGVYKKEWKLLYKFDTEVPEVIELYGSRNHPCIYPRLYAKLRNKDSIKLNTSDKYLMLDFINKYYD